MMIYKGLNIIIVSMMLLGTQSFLPNSSIKTVGEHTNTSQDFTEITQEWIAYTGIDCNIWLIHPDGSENKQLTTDGSTQSCYILPKWSQDGNQLAYLHERSDGYYSAWLFTVENSRSELIIQDVAGNFDWSPDGKQIVFDKPLPAQTAPVFTNDGFWIYDLTSRTSTHLVGGQMDTMISPDWSPDGLYIYWTRDYRAGFNTYSIQTGEVFRNCPTSCTWSPDGSSLICAPMGGDGIVVLNQDCTASDFFGDAPVQIENSENPVTSPNGTMVAADPVGYSDDFLIYDIDKNDWAKRTFEKFLWPPTWSPGSTDLLFVSRSNQAGIFNLENNTSTYLVDVKDPYSVAWQPKAPEPSISEWIGLKRELAKNLERVNIHASILTLPSVKAYDETSTYELLDYLEKAVENETITPVEEQYFPRLFLQEKSLSEILPNYADILALQADTFVDFSEVIISFNRTTNLVRKACDGSSGLLCEKVLREASEILLGWYSDGFTSLCAKTVSKSIDKDYVQRACQVAVKAIMSEIDNGKSLKELLVEQAIQVGLSTAFIQPYLNRSQKWLERGVRTADVSNIEDDEWIFSGDFVQARFKTEDLTSKTEVHQTIAENRYTSFQAGADFLRIATDMADLSTLTPWAAIGKIIGIFTRISQISLDVYVLEKNGDELECVEFLSEQANEISFNGELFQQYCPISYLYEEGEDLPINEFSPVTNSPLIAELIEKSGRYKKSVEVLGSEVLKDGIGNSQGSINAFIDASNELLYVLEKIDAILSVTETKNEQVINYRGAIKSNSLQIAIINLYIAGAILAHDNDEEFEVDFTEIAAQSTNIIDYLLATVQDMPLENLPDSPIVAIKNISSKASNDTKNEVLVEIENIGAIDINNLRVTTIEKINDADVTLEKTLQPGKTWSAKLTFRDLPDVGFVQVWSGEELILTELLSIDNELVSSDLANNVHERSIGAFLPVFLIILFAGMVIAAVMTVIFVRKK